MFVHEARIRDFLERRGLPADEVSRIEHWYNQRFRSAEIIHEAHQSLFLHADTIFLSEFSAMPRTVGGRDYDLAPLLSGYGLFAASA